MKTRIPVLAAAAVAILATPAFAQQPAASPAAPALPVIDGMVVKSPAKLSVTSPAFKAGGDIPFENTRYRSNTFPGLAWSKGPAGTKAYVAIMQDADTYQNSAPLVHWSLLNIPASVTKLAAGMTEPPAGASLGLNFRGAAGPYLGPHTPPGPKHHYHFQVFALDGPVADPGASLEVLTKAMNGHVLASGELVALAQKDPDAPPEPKK
jgi:para-nitrobenzyl esterase